MPFFRRLATFLLVLAPAAANAAIGLDFSHVDTSAPSYQRFKDWVDAAVAGSPGYAFSATDAVFMHRLDGDPAYCALAVQIVEAQVSAAEAAIANAQRPEVSGDSYLEVGEMIGSLALTYDACAAHLGTQQRQRWAAYAEQAVWNVWHPEQAQWGGYAHPWSGWSIDDPGNNYHFSFIEATMLWGLAADGNANHCGAPARNPWVEFLATVKLPVLQAFYADLAGGGSREGTGYGTAQMRLFWLYRVWRDAGCGDLAAASSHADDSILYWIHATVPTLDRFAPIGDQSRSSIPELFDYQRRLVLEARALSLDPARRAQADHWLGSISVARMQQGFNFRHDLLAAPALGAAPSERHWWAQGSGHLFARSDWSRSALWLAVIAGRFDQSHAHEDQGAFTLFGAGDWLAVTENIWTHSGIQQGGEVHNLVRFERADGTPVRQRRDTESTLAVQQEADGTLVLDADLTPAYAAQPELTAWQRQLRFDAAGLLIHDQFELAQGAQAIFQLNTPVRPVVTGATAVAGALRIEVLAPAHAVLSVLDWSSVDAQEFRSGFRLDVRGGSTEYRVKLSVAGGFFHDGFESPLPGRS